jgi:Repeat of unknown function (DUF6923)
MKTYTLMLCTLSVLGAAFPARASTLYGSTSAGGAGELWILNPANGAAVQDVGALNDSLANNYAVTGLAFDPVTGVLYGSTGGRTGTDLLTIDPTTALVTVIGSYNVGGATMTDLAFDSAGNLYGISSVGGANLYTINLATGQATEVGPSGVSFTAGGGLAISPGGVFYGTPTSPQFGTYDPNSGAFNLLAPPSSYPAGVGTSYAALAFDGNTLYGIDLGTPPHLVTFDTAGNITDIGATPLRIDGIAFAPVPEAGTVSLLSMGALLFVGVHRCKTRRSTQNA